VPIISFFFSSRIDDAFTLMYDIAAIIVIITPLRHGIIDTFTYITPNIIKDIYY